jgi:hypothetical protein
VIDPAYLKTIGVFFDESDRTYKRYRRKNANSEYDESDPRALLNGNLVAYDEVDVPFPVVVAAGEDARSIERAQAEAAALNYDFYHPTFGWLRWGRKPERDHPENLGAGTVQYERRRVTVDTKKKGK